MLPEKERHYDEGDQIREVAASSRFGRRGAKKPFDQIGEGTDFAVGHCSGPFGNRKAGGERADEHRPVANRRTNVFTEGCEFVDQLLTFKRAPVDPVRHQDQPRNAIGRTRTASTISSVRTVASRSKPEGVHGTSTRSEMALAAPSERSLGAVSMTT